MPKNDDMENLSIPSAGAEAEIKADEVISEEETSDNMTAENPADTSGTDSSGTDTSGTDSSDKDGSETEGSEAETENKSAVSAAPAAKAGKVFAGELKEKALISNPVLVRILAVCTVLGATTALKKRPAAVGRGTYGYGTAVCDNVAFEKSCRRSIFYPTALLIAGALETPVIMLAGLFAPEVTSACGFYLPITAVNSVLMLDLALLRGDRPVLKTFAASVGDVLGYAAVLTVISALREIIGAGSVYGRALPGYLQINFDFMLLPPGAFILLGLLLALVQGIKTRQRKEKTEVTRDEIDRSVLLGRDDGHFRAEPRDDVYAGVRRVRTRRKDAEDVG
jgi:electron transport complex protein RnfE